MTINFKIEDAIKNQLIEAYGKKIEDIFSNICSGNCLGRNMMGWIEWVNVDHSLLIAKAQRVRDDWRDKGVKAIVIIGTGGSYIGCRGGLEFSRKMFGSNDFDFFYVPYFSSRYLRDLMEYLQDKKFALVVISKSGTTLESSIAFRLLRELLFQKEKRDYFEYVVAITDKSKGVLRRIADKEKFVSFVIEDDIGGRYSTLTAVGLVPMILGGIDVNEVLSGAKKAYKDHFNGNISANSAALYSAYRHFMFEGKGLVSECLISYDPQLKYTLEAMKQLFAESEGKQNRGLMPIILDFTPDLHSVGQLIQDGRKSFFETTIWINDVQSQDLCIQKSIFENDDELDWIAGKRIQEVNECAFSGTLDAHRNVGKINNVVIELNGWKMENFGYLYYWLSLAAMFSAYLFEVNPFDQPGVETYKKRMFNLLEKC